MTQMLKVSLQDDAMISALQAIIAESQKKIASIMAGYAVRQSGSSAAQAVATALDESRLREPYDHYATYYFPAEVGEIFGSDH